MGKKLVPDDFKVPEILETPRFKLRMLAVTDVAKDYNAVITSVDYLQGVFGPKNKWPGNDLTFEQDLRDLKWHQSEFQNRTSFAYTVMKPDESQCLGCVYIYLSENRNYDAKILMWVRASEKTTGLDGELFTTIKKWVKDVWPFEKPAYPGREVSWDEWYNI